MALSDSRHQRYVEWLVAKAANTQEPKRLYELAEELNVAPRTLRDWRDGAEFQAEWRRLAIQVAGEPERVTQVMDALFEGATIGLPIMEDGVEIGRKLSVSAAATWLKATGVISTAPKAKAKDAKEGLIDLSEAELDAMIAEAVANQAQA